MMTRLLGVSRAAYYKWAKDRRDQPPRPGTRAGRRGELNETVMTKYTAARGAHGARGIRADLAADGRQVSLWSVQAAMKRLGIAGRPAAPT
jgi:hypothetical protein